jgi:hypothetical protein
VIGNTVLSKSFPFSVLKEIDRWIFGNLQLKNISTYFYNKILPLSQNIRSWRLQNLSVMLRN